MCVQRAVERATQAHSALVAFQVLCTACMVLAMLAALLDIPSVAAVASIVLLGARELLEQLIPVAIITTLLAFMLHVSEIAQGFLTRSRFPVTSILRFFLSGEQPLSQQLSSRTLSVLHQLQVQEDVLHTLLRHRTSRQ